MVVSSPMTTIRWRLNNILKTHNITAYKLEQALRGRVSRNTVYRWAKEMPQSLDLAALPHMLEALTRLTGQPVTPNDLLEVTETPISEEMDSETKNWLDASAADALEALQALEQDQPPEEVAAWLEAFHKAGTPVKFNQKTRKFKGQQ